MLKKRAQKQPYSAGNAAAFILLIGLLVVLYVMLVPSQYRDELLYGAAVQSKLLIDATIDWTTHPVREEWGNRRLPPTCTEQLPEVEQLAEKRWQEYGF